MNSSFSDEPSLSQMESPNAYVVEFITSFTMLVIQHEKQTNSTFTPNQNFLYMNPPFCRLRYDKPMNTKPQSAEYKAFESLLGQVLTVSKTELNRRIAEEKSEKRTPRGRASRVSAAPAKPA
jgi:hypothetical protein